MPPPSRLPPIRPSPLRSASARPPRSGLPLSPRRLWHLGRRRRARYPQTPGFLRRAAEERRCSATCSAPCSRAPGKSHLNYPGATATTPRHGSPLHPQFVLRKDIKVLGWIQGRLFHNIIKQSGRPPALAQEGLLHRHHHTTPWRGEFWASTRGGPRNSIKINLQSPGIHLPRRYYSAPAPSRPVSYFWCLCKVAAAAACINIMVLFVYHTYLVQVPYTSHTPFFHLETVPYTNRTHFVIRSPLDDLEYGESCFAFVRKNHSSKFLSPLHPDSVRVNLITAQLLRAVQCGLNIKSCDAALVHESSCKDVSLDARHAIESKKQGKLCRSQPQTAHLDGLVWEVIVVKNDRHVGAMSWPHGKIIVFTGLLNHLQTDAEIATVLAHEIAHMVARHSSESIIYKKWFPFPLKVHFVRRMEIEADRMGLLIMAAAGFDPHIAPVAVEKLVGNDIYHPSGKKRARLLSRAKVMDEALELYREVMPAKAPE